MDTAAPVAHGYIKRDLFSWADIVVDGRHRTGSPVAGIPDSLDEVNVPDQMRQFAQERGITSQEAWRQFGGRAATLMGTIVTTGVSSYRLDGYVVTDLSVKSTVLLVVHCPDGFRLGISTGPYGDYGASPDRVWAEYLDHSTDTLGCLFTPAYTSVQNSEAVEVALTSLRCAIDNFDEWWADVEDEIIPAAAGQVFVEGALMGFDWWGDYYNFRFELHNRLSFPDARAAGWRMDDPDAAAWIAAADEQNWPFAHFDLNNSYTDESRAWAVVAWQRISDLRFDGWSIAALEELHTEDIINTLMAASGTEPELTWREASEAMEWVEVTGSAQVASACIEAGLTLHEVIAMRAAGDLFDVEALRTLAALRRAGMGQE